MSNEENENDQFDRYVASQLNSLLPIWSIMLKSEIQNVITNIVMKSLSGPQYEPNKVFPSSYHRPPSQNASRYPVSIPSYHTRPSTPRTNVSQLSALSNLSPYSSSSPSSCFSPSTSPYTPPSSSSYPLPSSPLHSPAYPSVHLSLTSSDLSHSSHSTILPNFSTSNPPPAFPPLHSSLSTSSEPSHSSHSSILPDFSTSNQIIDLDIVTDGNKDDFTFNQIIDLDKVTDKNKDDNKDSTFI